MKLPVAIVLLASPLIAAAQSEYQTPAKVSMPATALPAKRAPDKTSGAISAKDLMTRLYIFADDSMMGREAGTLGNVKGTDYIASELERLGLVPAGDNGTFFQTIPLKRRSLDPASTVTLGGSALPLGAAWSANPPRPASGTNVPVVFGGTIGDSASLIAPAAAAGRFVVFRVAPGSARAARQASRFAPEAAAVAVITADRLLAMARRPASFLDDPAAMARGGSVPQIQISQAAAAELFASPLETLAAGAAGGTASFDLRIKADPVEFPARNVVALLPGSDPALRAQYVAIGAHNDHVGVNNRPVDHDSLRIFNQLVRPGGNENADDQGNAAQVAAANRELAAWRAEHPAPRLDSISNGADDDGSGSVALLEVAEALATAPAKPKRSVLFVWHTAEEKGLLGAAYFLDHPTVTRDSIVAALNMDMVGRGNATDIAGVTKDGQPIRGNDDFLMLVGSRRLSTELGDLVESVNAGGRHRFRFDYGFDANGHPMNIYCRSDHFHYARYGIPVTFFTTGLHSDYHQVTDEPQYIDYEHLARVASLVRDVAVRVANLDHRVVVDKPKPDPQAACRQ